MTQALGIAGWGALGALSGDPLVLVAWLALWAAPLGVAAPKGPSVFVALLVWGLVLFSLQATHTRPLPAPYLGLVVCAGFYAGGFGLGCAWPERRTRTAAWLLFAAVIASALPSFAGLAGSAPWTPAVAARLLDLAPTSLALESAGVDWLRHPAVYDPVGSSSIGPDLRAPYRGSLAATLSVVVGCLAAWGGWRFARREA